MSEETKKQPETEQEQAAAETKAPAAESDKQEAEPAAEKTEKKDWFGKKSKELEAVKAKLEAAEQANAKLKDQMLRTAAEYDNYRKRTTKEKMEAYGDATCRCIAEILPVLDSFERAIEAECTDESFKNGMQMIYTNFIDVLKKIGVTEMEALGNEFDPNLHNAIKKTEDENFGENTICEVFQKGYMFNDRVIRHAVVAVAN